MDMSRSKTGLRIDEQVVRRQPAAVDEDRYINNQVDDAAGFDGIEKTHERDDEDEVVDEEAEQLTEGVMPVRPKDAIEEVEGVAEEDAAKDDG